MSDLPKLDGHSPVAIPVSGARASLSEADDAAFRVAIGSINQAIIITSADLNEHGPRIKYVNPAFTRMTGYEAHEVLGKTPRILQGSATNRVMLDKMSVALHGGQTFCGEAINYRKDGSEYVVEWLITPVHGANGDLRHWVSAQSDVTERRQLEANLVVKEDRLRSIVASTLDYAIFVTDRDDRIIDWWPGAAAVYGWSEQQALGNTSSMTFTPEDRAAGIPEQEVSRAEQEGIAPNVRWHQHANGHGIFIEGSVRALRDQKGELLGFLKIGQDVTARKAAEKRLQDSEARLARAVAAAKMCTWEWSADSERFQFSVGVETLFFRPEGSISSVATMLEAIHPQDRLRTATAVKHALETDRGELVIDFRVPLPNGQMRWLLITGQAEQNQGETPIRLTGVVQDITERRDAEKHIAYMALHDGLTGLANRETLHTELTKALLRSRRGAAFAVLALDLDGFKEVNDVLGHAVGDAVLSSVAARLRRNVREVDIVSRPGGDEFVIIQSGLHQPRDAEILAAHLTRDLTRPHRIGAQHIETGVSIGIALVPQDGTELEQVLRAADLALYAAKTQARSSWRFFEPQMQIRVEARRGMEADLRKALSGNQFELHYQPLVDLTTRRVLGFEALLRWRHPVRGVVPPGEFIALAEETGLIEALGAWVLTRACVDAARWPEPLRVAVNLSVRQFANGRLPEVVTTALDRAGLQASRLDLEITENLLLRDTEENLTTLHQLRAQGVSISMDDFGTGYSSLSYVASFPFNRMKIDRSFVARAKEKQGGAIIRAVVDLCRSLDITVTAEGIETIEQLRQVSSLGCTEGQGFLLARPCPAADIPQLLQHWDSTIEKT